MKRIKKVVIPLVAWSMIYWIFANNYNMYSIFTVDFVQRLLANKIYYHLYFLYIILGLYIITPLLRRILKHSNMCDIHYYLVLWFIFSLIKSANRILWIQHRNTSRSCNLESRIIIFWAMQSKIPRLLTE
jgi:surface polysaccharide O-acyltransferase-like enzyme